MKRFFAPAAAGSCKHCVVVVVVEVVQHVVRVAAAQRDGHRGCPATGHTNPMRLVPFDAQGAHRTTIRGDQGHRVGR